MKIFLGIFIFILKHLLSLISKYNMSVLVSLKSTNSLVNAGQHVSDRRLTRFERESKAAKCWSKHEGFRGDIIAYIIRSDDQFRVESNPSCTRDTREAEGGSNLGLATIGSPNPDENTWVFFGFKTLKQRYFYGL